MALVLAGAHIKLYINNKLYKEVQGISFTVDYEENPIFGIDANFAQEITTTKVTVHGSIQGIRVKQSGGLQAKDMRPLFNDLAAAPYISIRIQDRSTGEDIFACPNAKVTRESHSVSTKGIYRLNFDFIGIVPVFALDRA